MPLPLPSRRRVCVSDSRVEPHSWQLPRADFEGVLAEEEEEEEAEEEGRPDPAGPRKVPLLDRSALLGEPELAAAVVQAILGAVTAAERRYPPAPDDEMACEMAGASGESDHARRLAMARGLCDAERAALRETQREALKLLVNAGLGEGESEDSDEGDSEEDGADLRAKRQRRAR